jgi:hypothetical protein
MKLLIEVEAPGLDQSHTHEPDVSKEVGAFVSKLIRSRTRGPEPKVTVLSVDTDAVVVDAKQLLALQSKANALKWLVECEDNKICEALERAKKLIAA